MISVDGCAICGKTGMWYSVPVDGSTVDVCEHHYGLYHTDRAMFDLELFYNVSVDDEEGFANKEVCAE